jgi:hypothetical protein
MIFAKILDQLQIVVMGFFKLLKILLRMFKGLQGELLALICNLLFILAPLKGFS